MLFGETDPSNSVLFGGTVPSNGVLFGGAVPQNSFPPNLKQTLGYMTIICELPL